MAGVQFSNFTLAKEAIPFCGLMDPQLGPSGKEKHGVHALELLFGLELYKLSAYLFNTENRKFSLPRNGQRLFLFVEIYVTCERARKQRGPGDLTLGTDSRLSSRQRSRDRL